MEKVVSHYVCGNNSFGQMDELLISNNEDEEGAMFYPVPSKTHMNKVSDGLFFTWSQIWRISDNDQTSCYGYKCSAGVQSVCHVKSVVPLTPNCILLQTHDHSSVMVVENNKDVVCKVHTPNIVEMVNSTHDHVYGIKDDKLYEGSFDNEDSPKLTFYHLETEISVTAVACGFEHTLVLTTCFTVYSFGSSSRGQLGQGEITVDKATLPMPVETLDGIHITHIAAGGWHSAAISDTGDIYMWGWNESGQLGLPNNNCNHSNAQLRPSSSQTENESGEKVSKDNTYHCNTIYKRTKDSTQTMVDTNKTCTDKSSDATRTLGDSKHALDHVMDIEKHRLSNNFIHRTEDKGQCEIPSAVYQDIESIQLQCVPYGLDLPDGLCVKSVVCGSRHTCVLMDNGLLMTAGWNKYGQLGLGDTCDRDCLSAVSDLWDRGERVSRVFAQAWNTHIVTRL